MILSIPACDPLLRRAGRLEEVPAILGAAEEKDRRSGSHAGIDNIILLDIKGVQSTCDRY